MVKYLSIIIVLLGMIFPVTDFSNKENQEYLSVKLSGKSMNLAVADNEKEQYAGLSNRPQLCSNCGMIFIFDNLRIRYFVMREMLFPIDIVWLKDNKIIGYVDSAKIENPPYTLYTSPEPVNIVLELPAGYIKNNKILVNDILEYGQ